MCARPLPLHRNSTRTRRRGSAAPPGDRWARAAPSCGSPRSSRAGILASELGRAGGPPAARPLLQAAAQVAPDTRDANSSRTSPAAAGGRARRRGCSGRRQGTCPGCGGADLVVWQLPDDQRGFSLWLPVRLAASRTVTSAAPLSGGRSPRTHGRGLLWEQLSQ